MRRQAQRAQRGRNIYRILATSAGLVLLVALALGYLGWRLLAQEDALQRQQAQEQTRKRQEQTAGEILAASARSGSATQPDGTFAAGRLVRVRPACSSCQLFESRSGSPARRATP